MTECNHKKWNVLNEGDLESSWTLKQFKTKGHAVSTVENTCHETSGWHVLEGHRIRTE